MPEAYTVFMGSDGVTASVTPRQVSIPAAATQKAQQPVWSRSQAWEGHPSTSSSSESDRHLSWTSSWSHLETSHRLPKKQVAGSDSPWQQPESTSHSPTCCSMEMCYPSRSFWADATVPADYAMTTTSVDWPSGIAYIFPTPKTLIFHLMRGERTYVVFTLL